MSDSGVGTASSSASDTASQLLAKILNQLSLAAWLPSGALVLLIGFAIELGNAVDHQPSAGKALSATFTAIGNTSIGGLLLVGLVIVVTTMVTQAFSFSAIRVLEGYWGTTTVLERLAGRRAERHRGKSETLYRRYRALRLTAIAGVVSEIEREQRLQMAAGRDETFTADMRRLLQAQVEATGEPEGLKVTVKDRTAVDAFDWRKKVANRNFAREELNLAKRLEDYPIEPLNVLPTRLGNVLRAHEDATGLVEVENYVDQVFDQLPFSMQLLHDEQRTRLDLYCSMVFVLTTSAAVAVLRFGVTHWPYQLAAVAAAGVGSWTMYRAALASARYYGSILQAIVKYVSNRDADEARRSEDKTRALFGISS